jgi:hypothetical protein
MQAPTKLISVTDHNEKLRIWLKKHCTSLITSRRVTSLPQLHCASNPRFVSMNSLELVNISDDFDVSCAHQLHTFPSNSFVQLSSYLRITTPTHQNLLTIMVNQSPVATATSPNISGRNAKKSKEEWERNVWRSKTVR